MSVPVPSVPVRSAPVRGALRPTRRTVLLLGASTGLAAGLAGCTSGTAAPGPASAPPVDPDDALRDAAAARERALLAEYDAVLLALPELAGRLVAVRGHHAEHLLALVGPPPTAGPSSSPTGGAPAPSSAAAPSASAAPPPAVPVPVDAAAALARLRAAEAAAGDGHAQDCLAASRPLAALLASLSASEHSHLVALA